jgi:hypothetical protein
MILYFGKRDEGNGQSQFGGLFAGWDSEDSTTVCGNASRWSRCRGRFASRHRLQHRFGFDPREALVLQADGEEDVAEAVDGGAGEELGGEIEGEAAAVGGELLDQRLAIKRSDKSDEFFNLITGEHKRASYAWTH